MVQHRVSNVISGSTNQTVPSVSFSPVFAESPLPSQGFQTGSQGAFSTQALPCGLTFVSPRILNRPIKSPSANNYESVQVQHDREQHRLEQRQRLHHHNHEKRNGSNDILVTNSPHTSLSAPSQPKKLPHSQELYRSDFLFDRDSGMEREEATFQRARAVYSGSQDQSYNTITNQWTDLNAAQASSCENSGRGKLRTQPAHMGNYNPITNTWIQPPKDPRYFDRENRM
mmetsp:Transcript_29888/g.41359  ORF Transcript_29888/g.41359 Transcript_29888/m.41359 type:complete len:228 (+) Transcript_29888:136-819(+)